MRFRGHRGVCKCHVHVKCVGIHARMSVVCLTHCIHSQIICPCSSLFESMHTRHTSLQVCSETERPSMMKRMALAYAALEQRKRARSAAAARRLACDVYKHPPPLRVSSFWLPVALAARVVVLLQLHLNDCTSFVMPGKHGPQRTSGRTKRWQTLTHTTPMQSLLQVHLLPRVPSRSCSWIGLH